MSRSSIESKIVGLENKLRAENERHDTFSIPKGPGLRKPIPAPLGEFKSDGTPVRPRKPLDLPFRSMPKPDLTETENKLKEIYKMQGKLKINGTLYSATQNDLEDLGELGNGSCGHVVKMLHKPSGEVIAVKQMRRSGNTDENKRIIMDLEVVLKSHDCPYIVQCLGCFITDADVWICMELMATCFDKLLKRLNGRPIPEDILGKVTVATVNALSYLKDKHGVIHRDVKPSNILLDERGRIKLCDFGISGRLVDSKAKTRSAGCAAYMAPERIDLSLIDYDIRADVWSLGITLVELATGQFPYFGCNNDFEVLTKVLEEDPPTLSEHGGFSMEFQNFVDRCLTKNYKQRPKYDELLKHPFVIMYTSKEVNVAEWFQMNDRFTNQRSSRFNSTPPISPKQHVTRRFFTFRNANDASKMQNAAIKYDTLPHNGLTKQSMVPEDPVKHYTSCTSYVSTNFLNLNDKVLNTRPSKYTTVTHGYNDLSGKSYDTRNLLEYNLDKIDKHLVPSKNLDLGGTRSVPSSPRLNDSEVVNNKFVPRHNLNYYDKYETIKSSANSKSDFHVLNKLRNGSPSFQRRCENFEDSRSSSPSSIVGQQAYSRPVYKTSDGKSVVNSGEQLSPFLAKRNFETEGFWQVTGKEALSPGFNRKRLQQFSDQQTASRSANTSPLLLERFYHQQNQHRRQASCSPQRQHQSQYNSVPTSARKILFESPNGVHGNTIEHQMNRSRQDSPSSDTHSDSQGAVKRRFASCIKVQLRGNESRGGGASGGKSTQNGVGAMTSSIQMLGNSSPVHHSDVRASATGNMCVNKLPEYLDHRRRHQSPDPPPRLNRDNPASPLAIHRSYLERLSSSPQSPNFQRRYPLTPQPPPRRLSDQQSLPGRPHFVYSSPPSNSAHFAPTTATSDDR